MWFLFVNRARARQADYAPGNRNKAATAMRQRLTQFVAHATQAVARTALLDAQLDALVAWLTAIASSVVRPYRIAATLAALSMSLALATTAAADAAALVTARRQSAASKRRSGGAAETPGAQRELERLAGRVARIDELLSSLFDGSAACCAPRFDR